MVIEVIKGLSPHYCHDPPQKLRTCSLPDLRLLFATVAIGNDSEDEHLE